MTIPVRVDVRKPGVYRGAVFVYVHGVQSPVMVLPIAAHACESAIAHKDTPRLLQLPLLVRKSPDVPSEEVRLSLVPHQGFTVEDVVSTVDWLETRLNRSGALLNICVRALPFAPEGPFMLKVLLRYKVGRRSGHEYLGVTGEVVSSVRVEPERLFLGVVSLRKRQTVVKEAEIILRSGWDKSLRVRATSPGFTARVRRVVPGRYIVEVRFVPEQVGEIRGYVECRRGESIICLLPVSVLVQP